MQEASVLAIHNIRATGSYIRGTNGTSNGIIPMLRVFNDTARYVDQGGGKRKGAFAIYLEPWHADIFDFLELRKNHGKEEMRARDLILCPLDARFIHETGGSDEDWSLFCPNEAPGLHDCYGEEFEKLYTQYEAEGRARKKVKAQELGLQFWKRRLKQERLTCCIKMQPTEKATSKIWVRSRAATCAQKLLNTLRRMKWPFVTWLPSHSQVCDQWKIRSPKII